jgi:hypothetical protein
MGHASPDSRIYASRIEFTVDAGRKNNLRRNASLGAGPSAPSGMDFGRCELCWRMCFLFALLAATSFEATVARCGAASSLRILRAIRLRVRILDDGAERTGEPRPPPRESTRPPVNALPPVSTVLFRNRFRCGLEKLTEF